MCKAKQLSLNLADRKEGKVVNFPTTYQPEQSKQRVKPRKKEPDIKDAKYWIPTGTIPPCEGQITIGKKYKIHYDEMRDEFYMLDDCGANTVWFLLCPGKLI